MLIKTKNGVFRLEKSYNATLFASFPEKAKKLHGDSLKAIKTAKSLEELERIETSFNKEVRSVQQDAERLMKAINLEFAEASRKIDEEANSFSRELLTEAKRVK